MDSRNTLDLEKAAEIVANNGYGTLAASLRLMVHEKGVCECDALPYPHYTAPEASPPAQALHIGPFYLSHGEAGRIALYTEDGEGGQFDIAKFEAHLKEFYDREF